MKKNVLALSIAAMIGGLGFVGTASADLIPGTGGVTNAEKPVNLDGLRVMGDNTSRMSVTTASDLTLSEGGVGHMLLVPYYSAQNNNMTVLHVVNTDSVNGKAVKVRFRGAANSDDVMDFQVFMSPGDVWTAAVTAGADGIAQVQTADNTCTVPSLGFNTPQAFTTSRLNPNHTDEAKASGTREGYVEIFNMADIPSDKIYTVDGKTAQSALFTAIKHVNAVAPCSVAGSTAQTTLTDIALENYVLESDAANVGFNTPTGGLMGDWYIINVPETTTFSGAATAVQAVGGTGRGNFVHFPQIDTSVSAASIDQFTADPLLQDVSFAGQVANYDFPDLSTPYTSNLTIDATGTAGQAQALATALATKSVVNEYMVGGDANFSTDWVFSSPTRRYAAAVDYTGKQVLFNTAVNTHYTAANTSLNATTLQACVTPGGAMKGYSREEDTQSTFVISPDTALKLCGETSVLSFGVGTTAPTKVLNAAIASRNVAVNYAEGWLNIGTTGLGNGLPVIGFAAAKTKGSNLGGTWNHRTSK